MNHTFKPDSIQNASLVDHHGVIYPLENPCIIGRSADCGLQIDDPLISRKHVIMQEDSVAHWWIADLRSTNGTYVNHQRISQSTLLKNNDSVRIGSYHFIFKIPVLNQTEIVFSDSDSSQKANFSTSNCWIMLGDIMESSALFKKRSYENVINEIGVWSTRCAEIIRSYDGTINSFLGDGFLAYWKQKEITAEKLFSLWQQLDAIRDDYHFSFRLVLHRGQLKMDGVQTRGQENISGDALNTLFRMDKIASDEHLKSLISQPAFSPFPHESLEKIDIDSDTLKVSLYTLSPPAC